MDGLTLCYYCPEVIYQTGPHGDRPGVWVHGTTRRKPCPSNAHGSTMATPRDY